MRRSNAMWTRVARVWPKFAEHCGELFSTSPVELGLYALQTGDSDHMEAAKAQLNPTESWKRRIDMSTEQFVNPTTLKL